MSELSFDVIEIKVGIAFCEMFIIGALTAILYNIQERWKNQIKIAIQYKRKSRKLISYISLGNIYMSIVISMHVLSLILFVLTSYDSYAMFDEWINYIVLGFSILALKAYYKVIDPTRRCKTILISSLILLLINIVSFKIGWKDNPYTALMKGVLLWMLSMQIERWNEKRGLAGCV